MAFVLWTRPAVRQLIERLCGVRLSGRVVGNYLTRWGFGRKTQTSADEQRPEAVQPWLEDEYPSIERRAKAEGAEIHWGDETALVNTNVRRRGDAPTSQPRMRPAQSS